VKLSRFEMDQQDVTGTSTDLDIYVLDPNGDGAAVSGAADIDEIIELENPAPGTYQLDVHGWGVGSTPANSTFHSWTILDRPNGGTLQVVDAPAQAVTGETGRVRFSWSNVEAGSTARGLFAHGKRHSGAGDDEGPRRQLSEGTTPGPLAVRPRRPRGAPHPSLSGWV
jgi:hypothetical protein